MPNFRAGGRIGDELVELEGRVETSTAKAKLIVFTNDERKIWVPKSQIKQEFDQGDGTFIFHIAEWFCKKENLI